MTPLKTIRSAAFLLLLGGLLCSCASYEVVLATGTFHQALDQQSLRVVWKNGNTENLVVKQEKGSGLQAPTITGDELAKGYAIGEQLRADLMANLATSITQHIAPFIAANGKAAHYELVVEMGRNVVRTDGSSDTTVVAYLHAPSSTALLWARSIQIVVPRFESSDALSTKFSSAIIEQMKSAGLLG